MSLGGNGSARNINTELEEAIEVDGSDEDVADNSGAPRRVVWEKVREVFPQLDDKWLDAWVVYYNLVCDNKGRARKHEMPADFFAELDRLTEPVRHQVCDFA